MRRSAALLPSLIMMRHSLIPRRPMQSSVRVKLFNSHEKRKISSAPIVALTPSPLDLSKTTFTRLKLILDRTDSAI